jgi:hypothetical protein
MADALQPARAALLEHRFTAPSPGHDAAAASGYNTDSTILEPGSRSGSRSTSHELAPVADAPRAPEQPLPLVSQLRELPASQPAAAGSALVRRTSWGGSASTVDTRVAFAAAAAAAAAPEPAQQQAKASRKRQRSETVPGGHSQQDVKRVGSFGSSGGGPSSVSPRENSEAGALAAAPLAPARPPTSTILNYFHKKSSGSAAAAAGGAHAPLRAADSSAAAHRRLLNATSGKASIDPIDLASPCQAPSSSVSSAAAAAGTASYSFVQLQPAMVTQPSPEGTADSIAAARMAGDATASSSTSASASACSSGGSSGSSSNPTSSSGNSASSSSSAAVDGKTAQQLMELRLQLAAAEERVAALQAACAAERDKRRAADVAVTSLTAQMASMRVQFQTETAAAAARGAAKEQRAREALESLVSSRCCSHYCVHYHLKLLDTMMV